MIELPGDKYAEQWLKQAEQLERDAHFRLLTDAEKEVLANAKARAQMMQHQPESEVAAAYLAAMKAKCAEEFGAFLENQALKFGKEFIPLLLMYLPDLIKSAK